MKSWTEHKQLIEKARKGDQPAMERLARLAREPLVEYVYRLTLQQDLTQDIVQETLLDMFRVLGKLKDADRFWPWLRRIAFHKACDQQKKKHRQRALSLSNVKDDILSPESQKEGNNALAKMVSRELSQIVYTMMWNLKPRYRRVLVLRCYEEMEYSEIAELMNCSEFNVRMIFSRAKRALQKQLLRNGFSKGSLLTTLILFGKITARSEAGVQNVSIAASTLKAGTAAAVAAAATGKTALVTIAAAGAIAVGTATVALHPDRAVENNAGMGQSSSVLSDSGKVDKAVEQESWFYYPQGPGGPVMMRTLQRGLRGNKTYCRQRQNEKGNYFYDEQENAVYINNYRAWNADLSVKRLPTDKVQLTEFLNLVEGHPGHMDYVSGQGRGLWIMIKWNGQGDSVETSINYYNNVLGEEYFRYRWPAGARQEDRRDIMHKRGWTYFLVDGQVNGLPIRGSGRLPFVYEQYISHNPWIYLIGPGALEVADGKNTAVYRHRDGTERNYQRGSFFKGLMRPWMGLHTLDTVRRDAAEQRVPFKTTYDSSKRRAIVMLEPDFPDGPGLQIRYTIDLYRDIIEDITFIRRGGGSTPVGRLQFRYLQDIEPSQEAEFVEPGARRIGRISNDVGMLWLLQLVNETGDG